MSKQKSQSIFLLTILGISFLFIIGILILSSSTAQNKPSTNVVTINNNGQQVIDITAFGGYEPRYIEAKANIDTILRVTTQNTYDCSSSIVLPSLNINQVLNPNGVTEFAIGKYKSGEEFKGTCSMGMYNFTVKFI